MSQGTVMTRSSVVMRNDWDRRALQDPLYWVYNAYGRSRDDLGAYYRDGALQAAELLKPAIELWGESPAGKSLLDIGVGIGRLVPGFVRLGFDSVLGVDISPEMVRLAREWCPAKNATFLLVPGDELKGVADSSIDFCFSYNVFSHMPDTDTTWKLMTDMSRVLRPGGFFQIHFKGRETLKQRMARLVPQSIEPAVRHTLRAMRRLKGRTPIRRRRYDPGHVRTWSSSAAIAPEKMMAWLEQSGMMDIRVEPDPEYTDGSRFWVTGRKPAHA